jgi:DNA-directed RNA polymerase subunit K/omega
MHKSKLSRTPNIDIEKIIKNSQQNKFDLVVYAAMLARSIQRKNRSNINYINAPVQALLEIGNSHGNKNFEKVSTAQSRCYE